MSKYLLLHGGMHGAWCWNKLIPELRSRGNEAWAIDLPGHGHDLTPRQNVTRQSYILAVNNFFKDQNLTAVTIVGHSLAGTILPEIWTQSYDRIDEIIFLAGLALLPGESPMDLIPQDRRSRYIEMAASSADNSFFLDSKKACAIFYNDLPIHEAVECYEKLTPQSLAVYLDKRIPGPNIPLPFWFSRKVDSKGRYVPIGDEERSDGGGRQHIPLKINAAKRSNQEKLHLFGNAAIENE